MILGSLNKFKKRSPKVLKPRSKDTRRTSGNTTRNDPFPPFLIIEAQNQAMDLVWRVEFGAVHKEEFFVIFFVKEWRLNDAALLMKEKGDEEMTHAKKCKCLAASRKVFQRRVDVRVSDLEKDVKDSQVLIFSSVIHSSNKVDPEDILHILIRNISKQQESQYTLKSSDKDTLKEFDQKRVLFETMTSSKSFNKHLKHKALYHALMESILMDENAIDQVCISRRDMFEAEDTQVPQDLGEDMGNTDEPPIVKDDSKDWFKKPDKGPPIQILSGMKVWLTSFTKALAGVMSSSNITWKNVTKH
ncbi:hypothetical protein Tco_1215583 [Tanacetum coccineum]